MFASSQITFYSYNSEALLEKQSELYNEYYKNIEMDWEISIITCEIMIFLGLASFIFSVASQGKSATSFQNWNNFQLACLSGYRFNSATRWPGKVPTEITEVSREDGKIVSLPLPAGQFENFADYKEPLSEDASELLLPSPTAHMLNSTFRWDAHAQVSHLWLQF